MMKQKYLLGALAMVCVGCGGEVSARADTSTKSVNDTVSLAAPPAVAVSAPAVDPAPVISAAVLFSDLDAEPAARMDGVVQVVNVELGDAVRAGQVLAVLDDAREVARVESATASRDLARATFIRTESLLKNGYVTTAQMDEARFALRAAEATLREAQVELEHTRVVAPFSGVITRRMTGIGRAVAESEALFRLTALQPLRALVRVPERDAQGLRAGARAVLITESGAEIAASIQRVSPATDPASGTVEVLLNVPRPGPLRPGSTASARLR